jgi:hypothetical protein
MLPLRPAAGLTERVVRSFQACVYRKLDSAMSVVKPIENRSRDDGTKALDRSMNGSVLVQGAMRPRLIIIVRVGLKDPAQVPLAQGDDVIDALATDRSDQPLGEAVLPRRALSSRRSMRRFPLKLPNREDGIFGNDTDYNTLPHR